MPGTRPSAWARSYTTTVNSEVECFCVAHVLSARGDCPSLQECKNIKLSEKSQESNIQNQIFLSYVFFYPTRLSWTETKLFCLEMMPPTSPEWRLSVCRPMWPLRCHSSFEVKKKQPPSWLELYWTPRKLCKNWQNTQCTVAIRREDRAIFCTRTGKCLFLLFVSLLFV